MSERQKWIATLANERDQHHNAEVRWITGDVDMMYLASPDEAASASAEQGNGERCACGCNYPDHFGKDRAEQPVPNRQCEADCREQAVACCDICDHWFCRDHGKPGGDRQVQDVGAVAYPSMCYVCAREDRAEQGVTGADSLAGDAARQESGDSNSEKAPTNRDAFAWLYQWAGAMNAPAMVLDNLSALAQGKSAPHEWKHPTPIAEQGGALPVTRPKSLENMEAWIEMDSFSEPWACDLVRYAVALERTPERRLTRGQDATPDLLAALKLCMAELRYYPGETNRDGDQLIDAAMMAAGKAIAKAEGKQ